MLALRFAGLDLPPAALVVYGLIVLLTIGVIRAMRSPDAVVRHWSHLFDGLAHSSKEFYAALEDALDSREIPNTKQSFIRIREFGPFSGLRLYLRTRRREQVMDICAASFGGGFFVSWWLIIPPSWLKLTPIIGWIVSAFSRPTYYSLDTAFMFQGTVHAAVQEVIDGMTTTGGVRALTEGERKPIMRNFLR